MTERDAYVVRENPSQRMEAANVRTAISNILETEGLKPQYAVSTQDTSAAHLPSVELSDDKIVAIKKMKAAGPAGPQTLELEGGVRGLFERTDDDTSANVNNRLTREEIQARFGENMSRNEATALKDLYVNFSQMDRDGNGRISLRDIESRQDTVHSQQQLLERLSQFRKLVASRRSDFDTNNDRNISREELRHAGSSGSAFTQEQRELIDQIRENY